MSLPEPIVFIVDDDPAVRETLTRLVRAAGWRALAFPSGGEFLRHAPGESPSCLVLDARLPELPGLDLHLRLSDQGHSIPVVFIDGHDRVLAAVRIALESDRRSSERHAHAAAARDNFVTLTVREREVMALVVRGLLNKQIAATLGISLITIKVHRRRLMQKMKASSLPELVRMAEVLPRARARR